jgi:formate hydrogenlyase subunit 6/NADH:ubiquinone oxidoreductase subunit I
MSRLKSLIYLLPQLWETLLDKAITVGFPFGPLEIPTRFRGRVKIEPDQCRGCGACVRDCPAFGLDLERESRDEFRLTHYPDRCICCGQCEDSCNFAAIRLTNEFVEPTIGEKPCREILVDRSPDEGEDGDGDGDGDGNEDNDENEDEDE